MRKLNPSEPIVSANAVPSARKARTKTSDKAPGARAAKHSKAVVEEAVTAPLSDEAAALTAEPAIINGESAAAFDVERIAPESASEPVATPVSSEAIAKLAYSYWEQRGYQGGNPHEDWVRAEQELLAMGAGK